MTNIFHFIFALLLLATPLSAAEITIPAGIDHEPFDQLLAKYVDDRGLVDYAGWKESAQDVAKLDAYLSKLAAKPGKDASGNERTASAVNAYNATGIRLIIEHYPVKSIKDIKDAFAAQTHLMGGQKVSLDQLENDVVRVDIGWKAHAILVCCAISCPPLQPTAYTTSNLKEQTEKAYANWLRRSDLNKFMPAEKLVKISSIFKWYKADFEKAGGVGKILAQFAPKEYRDLLKKEDYEIEYLDYDWQLNSQANR